MNSTEKRNDQMEDWLARISECKNSGLTIKEWCSQHQVTPRMYFYWRRKARMLEYPDALPGHQKREENEFVELPVRKDPSSVLLTEQILTTERQFPAGIVGTIRISGISVEVTKDMPLPMLNQIMEAILDA